MTYTANEVRRIREELRLTQTEFAAALGVSRDSVARWEAGTRQMSEPTARLLQRIRKEAKTKKRVK